MDAQPIATVGAVLLGRVDEGGGPSGHGRALPHHVPRGQLADAGGGPRAHRPSSSGVNGCFNAFRVLEQDVHAFEEFLETSAGQINDELARRRGGEAPERRRAGVGQGAGGGQAHGPVAQRGAALAVPLDAGSPRPRPVPRPGPARPHGPGLPQRLRLHRRGGGPRRLRRHLLPPRRPHPSHEPPGQPDRAAQRQLHPADRAAGHAVRAALRPRPPRTTASAEGCSGASCAPASSPSTRRSCTTGRTSGCRIRASPAPTTRSSAPTARRRAGSRSRSTAATPSSSPGSPGSPPPSARPTCSARRSAPCASSPTSGSIATR